MAFNITTITGKRKRTQTGRYEAEPPRTRARIDRRTDNEADDEQFELEGIDSYDVKETSNIRHLSEFNFAEHGIFRVEFKGNYIEDEKFMWMVFSELKNCERTALDFIQGIFELRALIYSIMSRFPELLERLLTDWRLDVVPIRYELARESFVSDAIKRSAETLSKADAAALALVHERFCWTTANSFGKFFLFILRFLSLVLINSFLSSRRLSSQIRVFRRPCAPYAGYNECA